MYIKNMFKILTLYITENKVAQYITNLLCMCSGIMSHKHLLMPKDAKCENPTVFFFILRHGFER